MGEEERRRTIAGKLARMSAEPGATLDSGFPSLDRSTGGIPRGAILELFGAAGTGKTTLALQMAAHVQRSGGGAAWIDADRCFDAGWAVRLGVDLERLAVAQPGTAEEALEMARTLALSGAVDLVVVDSAAALAAGMELAAGVAEGGEGMRTRVVTSGLRRLDTALRRSGTAALFLNQTRARSGTGTGEIAAGGAPLKLFAAVRVALAGSTAEYGRVRFRVRKSRAGGGPAEGDLVWRNEAGFAERP
jgi:recombination protein RecA